MLQSSWSMTSKEVKSEHDRDGNKVRVWQYRKTRITRDRKNVGDFVNSVIFLLSPWRPVPAGTGTFRIQRPLRNCQAQTQYCARPTGRGGPACGSAQLVSASPRAHSSRRVQTSPAARFHQLSTPGSLSLTCHARTWSEHPAGRKKKRRNALFLRRRNETCWTNKRQRRAAKLSRNWLSSLIVNLDPRVKPEGDSIE